MKYKKYILSLISFYCFFNLNVYANACSYKEQTTLNNDLANVKITYEVENNNQINILIYNITKNIYISYTNPDKLEQIISYNKTDNGKFVIIRDANFLEEYVFEIRSNISSCYGKILTTKKIIKPKYNEYHTLEICNEKGLENHSYCQEFITQDINKTEQEVEKVLQDFLSAKVTKITTSKVVEDNSINVKKIISISIIGIIIIGTVITLLLVKKKRSEL